MPPELVAYVQELESKVRNYEKQLSNSNQPVENEIVEQKEDDSVSAIISFIQNHPDAIFLLNRNGQFLAANKSFTKIFNTAFDDIRGTECVGFFGLVDQAELSASFDLAWSGSNSMIEFRHTDFNNDTRQLSITFFPFKEKEEITGVCGLVNDNTELRNTQASLNQLLENASEIICKLSMTGDILSHNSSFYKTFGYSEEELAALENPHGQLLHPDDLPKVIELMGEIHNSHSVVNCELRYFSKEGDLKYIQWSLNPVEAEGTIYAIGRDVTESKKNNDFQKLILESIFDYFYVLDRNFNVTYINKSTEKLLQLQPGELIGKNLLENFQILQKPEFRNHLEEALVSREPIHFEYYSEVLGEWFDQSFYPTEEGISVFFRSIETRKKVENDLKDQKLFFEQMFLQSGVSTQLLDKDGWCQRINRKFSEYFEVSAEEIEGRQYNIFYDAEIHVRGIDAVLRKVVSQKKVVQWESEFSLRVASDLQGESITRKKVLSLGCTAYPILNAEGDITHFIIQHQDISERLEVENAILKSEAKYRKLFEHIDLGLMEVDNDEIIVKAYPKFCEMVGYKESELLGRKATEILVPKFETRSMKDRIDARSKGETDNYEFTIQRKNGEILDVIIVGTPIMNLDGQVTGSMGLHYDITARKKAERDLIKQKEQAETILSNIPIMIGFYDKQGCYEYVNPFWEKQLGWTLNEMIQADDFLVELYPDPVARNRVKEIIETGSSSWMDSQTISRSQGLIHTSWINVPLSDGRKIAIGQNITDRKNAEAEIRISNERYKYVTQATFDAIWDSDLVHNTTYWGEGFKTLFGYSPNAMKDMGKTFMEFLHPDDQLRVDQSFRNSLAGDEINWIEEYQFWKADGEYAFVQDKAIIIRNASGEAVRVIGAMHDITRQKKEEQRLKLLESVITNSSDSILIAEIKEKDPLHPQVVYVNPTFELMSGYSIDEIRGKTRILFKGENSDENDFARLNEAFRLNHPVEFEALNYRRSGEEYWVSTSLIPVASQIGQFTHWIAIQRDTTRRKKREMEREQLVKDLTRTNQELKQFSFITSHNMRAPLTNLMAILDLLDLTKITDETTLVLMEGFRTSTMHLNSTLNDLFEILIIKEKNKVEVHWVSFEETCQKIQESIRNQIQDSGAMIHANFSMAPGARFNPAYMESIFLNLLTNSIKFAKKDRKPIVFIYSLETEHDTQLIFEDNGLGFNMTRVQNKIFGLYQKFHNHPDSKGIGLYLVHSQVTSLGGSIEVESEENEGTKFIISFPHEV